MQIYSPTQRKDGRWDYTLSTSSSIYPIGYCMADYMLVRLQTPWAEAGEAVHYAYMTEERYNAQLEKTKPFLSKYHADGHATSEEAIQCYKDYCLDQEVRTSENANSAHPCLECKVWTPWVVRVGQWRHLDLCPEHQSREFIEKYYEREK